MKKYRCLNIGNCDFANTQKVFEISEGEKIECPKCHSGTMLVEVKNANYKKVIAIVVGILLLAIIGGIIAFSGGDAKGDAPLPEVAQDTLKAEKTDSVVRDVDMQTLDILEEPIILRPGGHQQLTVSYTPEDQTEYIIWSSSDETVARVTTHGKVEAIAIGKAFIIAKSDRTGIADTAEVSVEGPLEEEKTEPQTSPTPKSQPSAPAPKASAPAASSGSKNLGYATFKGSWPNDVNGRMVFNTSHVIDSKDPKKRVAEAGDYVIGEWSEGHLVQGIWYDSNNQVKGSVIIGK